ncbi:hypothetical protein J4G37_54425, partial [Microvirga sp. 3-52]|nr:hypothetical protein [Microvirga sp. 3-52]
DMIQHHQLFACSAGSALHDKGVVEFLDLLDQLTETGYCNDSDFAARVYKIRHDENGNRITYLKSISGLLTVRDDVKIGSQTEKITQIRLYNGRNFESVNQVNAGQLFAVAGLKNAYVGDG